MKPLEELDHYEVLEIAADASAEHVEKAYRMLQATYQPDSLAVYSLLDSAHVTAIGERIDAAYHVLSDDEERQAYDAHLREAEAAEKILAVGAESDTTSESADLKNSHTAEDDETEQRDFDGAGLRRARERRGISLEHIAGMTKINPTYLRWIEENSYEELPAHVYVRGFVTAYASAIGLDPDRVAASYMARLEQARNDSAKGRRPTGK